MYGVAYVVGIVISAAYTDKGDSYHPPGFNVDVPLLSTMTGLSIELMAGLSTILLLGKAGPKLREFSMVGCLRWFFVNDVMNMLHSCIGIPVVLLFNSWWGPKPLADLATSIGFGVLLAFASTGVAHLAAVASSQNASMILTSVCLVSAVLSTANPTIPAMSKTINWVSQVLPLRHFVVGLSTLQMRAYPNEIFPYKLYMEGRLGYAEEDSLVPETFALVGFGLGSRLCVAAILLLKKFRNRRHFLYPVLGFKQQE